MTHPFPAWRAAFRRIVLPLLLVLSLAAPCLAVPSPVPVQAPTPSLPLDLTAGPRNATPGQLVILPWLSAFPDTNGDMSVEEVAAPDMLASFRPLHPRTLPRSVGVTWLRLEIPAAGMVAPAPLLLDLGQGVPAGAVLHVPDIDPLSRQTQWQEVRANWRNLLPLPQPGETARVCYIRLDGQPPLWFAPTLRTPDNLANAPESLLGPAAMLTLAVVMLLALLRGITERGQWRFWTALYVGAALCHAVLGVPDLGAGNITPADAVSAMAPGLALMFLAHLARHLMQTAAHSRPLDLQYLLLSLPGAVLALLPLWPDFAWLGRFLPLWPLLALIFVPTSLGAWLMGVPGARRFLLGCLVAALGAALALFDPGTLLSPFIQGSLPLWSTALSALIIAGMSAPGRVPAAADPLAPHASGQTETITDPNLRLLDSDGNTLPLTAGLSRPAPAPVTVAADDAAAAAIRRLEQALGAPLRDLLEQNRRLEACPLSPGARAHVERMGQAARQALQLLHDPAATEGTVAAEPPLREQPAAPRSVGENTPVEQAATTPPPAGEAASAEKTVFDLRLLLQRAHETCRPLSENAAIHLNWRLPPDLAPRYEGPATALEDILRRLLADAIRATTRGSVQFTVRRVPDSNHPGHLLFQVRDTGAGLPPARRSAPLLARIWELAAANGGFLGLESGPRGTSVIFTLQLAIPQAAPATEGPAPAAQATDTPVVLVCAPEGPARQELAAMLHDCACRQARTLAHGLAATVSGGEAVPAVLLVSGPEAATGAAPLLRRFRALAEKTGPFGAVALTPDQSQWDVLAHAGFTHALTLPVTAEALHETIQEILGSHDDVADLGEPLPEKTADAPLPDLFGPAPQAAQDMPDLLLPEDGLPARPAPTAPAAGGDIPDLFAAPSPKAPDATTSAPEDALLLTAAMRSHATPETAPLTPDGAHEAATLTLEAGETGDRAATAPDTDAGAPAQAMPASVEAREPDMPLPEDPRTDGHSKSLPETDETVTARAVVATAMTAGADHTRTICGEAPEAAPAAGGGAPDMPATEQPEADATSSLTAPADDHQAAPPTAGTSGDAATAPGDTDRTDAPVPTDDPGPAAPVADGNAPDNGEDAAAGAETSAPEDDAAAAAPARDDGDEGPDAGEVPNLVATAPEEEETEAPCPGTGDEGPAQAQGLPTTDISGLAAEAAMAGDSPAREVERQDEAEGPAPTAPAGAAPASAPETVQEATDPDGQDHSATARARDDTREAEDSLAPHAPSSAAVPESVEEAAATPLTARRDDNVRLSAAPQDAEEWVGEPVPVGSPVARPATMAVASAVMVQTERQEEAVPAAVGGTPEDAAVPESVEEAAAMPLTARRDHSVRLNAAPQRDVEEWVGEPVPVGSSVARPAATAVASAVMVQTERQEEAVPAAVGGTPEDAAVPESVEEAAAMPLTARRDHSVRPNAAPQQDVEEWVGEPVPVSSPVARPAATAVATGGAYVSPCLHTAGEWVGEPMPIGTPVSRPAPVRAEEAPAPERTVVTVRPLRRDVSPDEIARQLGKPSLVPTDKSALITPPPRGGAAAGPAPRPAAQPPFPKSVPAGESRAVPGSKDVSSPPDVTPDTNALLSSHQEGPSRTRAAANTLMRFLSRFHAGSDQAADGEQAPAAEPERQGRPQPIRKADESRPETASAATGNPWIERRIEDRPSAPVRVPVPPRPSGSSGSSGRPQPPDDPANPLPALMWRLDNHLAEAGHALEQRRLHLVADAAGRLAAEAESYGFRVLGRMARCVERAGRAKDLQAVTDLLPELATALERHRISLDS